MRVLNLTRKATLLDRIPHPLYYSSLRRTATSAISFRMDVPIDADIARGAQMAQTSITSNNPPQTLNTARNEPLQTTNTTKPIDTASIPPTTAVSALTPHKIPSPPPETPHQISLRRKIIASFWLLILFLGLPLWVSTQRVVRSPLPTADMNLWSSGQACVPKFDLRVEVEAPGLSGEDARALVEEVQGVLGDEDEFGAHHLRLRLSSNSIGAGMMEAEYATHRQQEAMEGKEEVALTIRLLPGDVQASALQPYDTILDIYYHRSTFTRILRETATRQLATFVASELRAVFKEERNMIKHLLASSPFGDKKALRTPLQPAVEERLRKRDIRAVKYARTYHLTFSLFTPGAEPSTWPIEEVLRRDMAPLLSALSPLSNFTVDSQIQLFASAGVSPVPVSQSETEEQKTEREEEGREVKKEWRREDLSSFVNHAEWPLTPSIGEAPTLHFLVYISPYPIAGKEGQGASSFLIPQTGGVVILASAGEEDLKKAMRIFSGQLFDLLGAPSASVTGPGVDGKEGNTIKLSLPLRLGALVRYRTLSLLLSTSSTLASLLHLTSQLSSIPIPESVSELTTSTIANLGVACNNLGNLRGLEAARTAMKEAEKAFFDKRMVGQVYFPDEHRVAVLLPLLGPVGVPLVMAVGKEAKAFVAARRASKI